MKQKFKICAIVLTIVFALTGCSAISQISGDSQTAEKIENGNNQSQAANEFKSNLSAERVGNVNIDSDSVEITQSGIIYKDVNDNYGVLSLDGKNDTGAKYTYADETSGDGHGYISVYIKNSNENDVNCCGLVDSNGKEILETKYGFISILSERYAKVITADSETTDEDKALFYSTNRLISLAPDSEDTMYSGEWQIYDLKNNKFIKNVSGSLPYNITVNGSFIKFVNDEKTEVTVDEDGNKVSEGTEILDNGSYIIENNGNAQVYSTEGEKLFEYSTAEYDIRNSRGDYYLAWSESSDLSQYFLVDSCGRLVSSKFNSQISDVYADFLICDDKIYNFDGEEIAKGEYSRLYFDNVYQDAYYVKNDDSYVIFDKKGNTLYKDDNSENGGISHSDFSAYKKKDNYTYQFYNFTDNDFTIEGNYLSDWLVSQESDEVKNVVETRSGKTIIENYDHYTAIKDSVNGIQYVFAYNIVNDSSSSGNFDVYTVN